MSKESKGSGWFEKPNPLTDKAPIHQEVARKKEFEKQGFTGATTIVPHTELEDSTDEIDKDTVTLNFNVPEKGFPEFVKLSEEFTEQTGVDIRVESEGDSVIVKISAENICDFTDFVADKGYELDDDETAQIDEIIEKGDAAKEAEENSNGDSSE